jgi:hypothetical protein
MATALMTAPPEISWVARLRADGAEGRAAVGELHALLLKAARFEIGRRAAELPHLRGGDHEDLAQQAADDALMAVLRKLDDFRGESRFTTWAYKFALLEARIPGMRAHLDGCPACAEDFASLRDLVTGKGIDSGASYSHSSAQYLHSGSFEYYRICYTGVHQF